MAFECPFCNRVLSSRSAYSQHVKRCSENYDSSSSSSSEEIQNEFDIITPEQDDNSEDNRNNEIIYISDDEPMFSSRSNETSNIMQVEIDELPQSINSLTFKEFTSIRYEEPASREPEFETDESKSKSDETETETDSESKSDKTEFESDKTDNESDESEESESAEEETETIPKFPNNTYSDLMTLIIQHNLNNKAGNAIIRFFNKHSNLPTSLLPKNIEQGKKLMDKMKLINLLNKKKTNNNRNYNKQYTSNWWAQTEKTLPTGSYLLSIILYFDASTTDSLGKNTLHPIFVTLDNIITWRRNKLDVKQLLAYLPIIKAKDNTQKISEEHKNIVRRTFHKSLKFLLSPLYDDNGIELELNNSIFWCFPRISMIISDWPEACTFALTYKSTKSNYPCHFCLVFKEDLSNINLNSNQIEPRSYNNMKLYYKNNTGKKNINIYAATVPDRIHHFDLGLFQHQLNFTKILINKQCGKSVIDEMNRRVKLIPRYKDLKSFPNGFLHLILLTASEYRSLMKIMIFIVDELYEDSRSPNFIKNNKITEVYLKWNKMYLLSRKENYEESDVTLLQAKLFIELFKEHSKFELQFPKLHLWVFHICASIREFDYVKKPYKLTNKKKIEKQIMKIICRKAIITESFSKEIPKTPIALKYSKKLYEFCIQNAEIYIQTRMNDPDLEKEMKLGFEKFLECLDAYLDFYDQKLSEHKEIDMIFHIYGGVTLKFGSIMRATNKFYKKPIFSNIAVEMNTDEIFEYTSDNGVLLITEIIMNYEEPMHLALVQWYDFTSSEDLSNINLNSNQIEPRSYNNMKLYYKNNTGKKNINIYAATVPDRIHHFDLGLFQHQLNFTKILINKQCGKSVIDEMNRRVKLIPRYKDLKSFPNGFLHLILLTASEYRSLMKIMIFIVDELYEDSRSPNFIKNNKITEVYLKWNKMYLLSRKENYEESDVTLLQAKLFIELFKEHSKFELQFPKLHLWVFHICASIREFDYVKKPYKLTNKKKIEKQIMKIICRKAIITESFSKEIPKTPIALKYSKKLYEFCIQNAEIYIQTRMNDPDLEKEMKLGFEKFLECLDAYLDFYDQKLSEHKEIDMIFHIYGGVTLKFGSIMRATNKFYKKPIFSNIAVEMNTDEIFEYTSDNGVLLITEIIMNYEEPMHLALVQWYDFTSSIINDKCINNNNK
ncbi:hypothetical protein Glove_52g65 [Diversispora epigaea]|uniref:Uncharacterized protein n=1 Tax=Diversispora epigaea TaxID=1348612 RepID=A0A397JHU2_9GLOM|nr:hypothetical protein Glove_52g65 [Diversispora epigaea]